MGFIWLIEIKLGRSLDSKESQLRIASSITLATALTLLPQAFTQPDSADQDVFEEMRLCVFNIQDLRAHQIADPAETRLNDVARVIAAIRPDVLLVNELEYSGGWNNPDSNPDAQRTPDALVARLAVEFETLGVSDLSYTGYAWASNTGVASGLDFNRDGVTGAAEGTREYGGDCFGYGEFPGQYAMGLLVRDGYEVLESRVRTFALFRWADMPDAMLPLGDGQSLPTDQQWYTDEMQRVFRLSSKSHWDIPIRTPNGEVVHILASHPTPPTFDGPENRNGKRNHDEIRFWAEYVGHGSSDNPNWITDDHGKPGGIADAAHYVLMGDLNADTSPRTGESDVLLPARRWLVESGGFNTTVTPKSAHALGEERMDLTARWGRRVDYVLPGKSLGITRAAVFQGWLDAAPKGRIDDDPIEIPSDHFPVWVDIAIRRTQPANSTDE